MWWSPSDRVLVRHRRQLGADALTVDPEAEFLYVAADQVIAVAEGESATPYDVKDVELGHVDGRCSFESIILKYELQDPALDRLAIGQLPGRPRWAVYDHYGDRFLVNIREPAMVAVVSPETAELANFWSVSSTGPHGLDLDRRQRRAFVAYDGAEVVCLDADNGRQLATVAISGNRTRFGSTLSRECCTSAWEGSAWSK